MRKHKSVVAILLAVMMIFTFMPTMAFAQGPVTYSSEWSNNYSRLTVTSSEGKTWNFSGNDIQYTWLKTDDDHSLGLIRAELNTDGMSQGTIEDLPIYEKAYFYDFTGAELAVDGVKLANTYKKSEFEADNGALFTSAGTTSINSVLVKMPSYVKGYDANDNDAKNGVAVGVDYNPFTDNWTMTVKEPKEYDAASINDQSLTLTAAFSSTKADGTEAYPDRIDETTVSKTVTVSGTPEGAADIKFYKDSAKTANAQSVTDGEAVEAKFAYDGTAHKLINSTVDGYTVSWAVLNESTGKYVSADDCPTVTNVGDTATVRATISHVVTSSTSTSTTTRTIIDKTYFFNMKVAPANGAYFQFLADGNDGAYAYTVTKGSEYNALDYVVAVAGYSFVGSDNNTYNMPTSGYTDSDVDAVAANADLLKEYFNEFWEVKESSTAAAPDTITLTIVEKADAKSYASMNKAEKNAFDEKYGQMLQNLGTVKVASNREGTRFVNNTATLTLATVKNTLDDDISFEGQTKYVYSGKKTTKKGVLKAKKTIQVKATADSGNAITYVATKTAAGKIVVSKAGKITVKKGLKKGTYKVTVKAKTAAGNGYKAAKEKQTYTIVIKK